MSAVTGQVSSNDGTIYNSYHQAGTAQSFCESAVSVLFVFVTYSSVYNYIQLCINVGKTIKIAWWTCVFDFDFQLIEWQELCIMAS